MTFTVLSTKLFVPPLRSKLVRRTRLIQRMEEGLQQSRRLTLISAPAGFGKTTLVSEWIHSFSSDLQPVWFSLDKDDNDFARFLHYLIAALKRIDDSIGISVLSALQSRQPALLPDLVALLINDIVAAGKPVMIILDDFHLIRSVEVHQLVELLLDRQPQTLHMVILTREDPPLPLPRMRARGQVTEIRERDLHFSEREAALFFQHTMGLELEASAINALAARTEGWITGLQLAAVAIQEAEDEERIQQFISTFTGSDRYIVDYLVSEVLSSLPERVRDFLVKTSILERLCGPLCDALLVENGPGEQSQATLNDLERMNLFIIPLDNQRKWYRYHHLFGDLLRLRLDRLGAETVREMHQRAAEWLGADNLVEEAVSHALAARNTTFAADLVNHNWRRAQHEGRPKEALKWIEMLPQEVVANSALLSAAEAWTMYLLGRIEAVLPLVYTARRALAAMEAAGQVPEDDFEYYSLPGQMAAMQALIALRKGETESGRAFAREAIRIAPPQDMLSLGLSWSALGGSYREEGDLEEAIRCYYQAIEKNIASGNIIASTLTARHLGSSLQIQGRLQEAEALYQSLIDQAAEKAQQQLPAYGVIKVTLAEIYYERNELEKARVFLDQGLEQGRPGGYLDLFVVSAILKARLRKASGDLPGAVAVLEETAEMVRKVDEPIAGAGVAAWIARMQAETDDQASLLKHIGQLTGQAGAKSGHVHWLSSFTLVRLQMTLARWEEALALATDLEKAAGASNSVGRQIEALLLQAEILWQCSTPKQAFDRLSQALSLAETRGFRRIFLDEGPRLHPVLAGLLAWPDLPLANRTFAGYLFRELQAAGPGTRPVKDSKAPVQQVLIDPLSEREIEVLRLLSKGLKLAEIAKLLYLSPNTLKAHTQNIYGKLETHSRVEAANKARELGLID